MKTEDSPDFRIVAQRIASSLGTLGMSQKELAQRIAVSPQYVNQILAAKKPAPPAKLLDIERALGMTPGTLCSPGMGTKGRRGIASLANMPGIDVEHLRVAMAALAKAQKVLKSTTPAAAIRPAKGKRDTLFFDAACEDVIVKTLRDFDDHSAIFTEERHDVGRREFAKHLCFFIDPFDRSTPFEKLLNEAAKRGIADVGKVLDAEDNPLQGLNAPYGSISCVRDEQISFNVMMDYCSGEIYVACKAMIRHGNIVRCADPDALATFGEDTCFEPREGLQFTCFLGKKDSVKKRELYEKHLRDLDFLPGGPPAEHLQDPGGPARILFLSDLCKSDPKLAAILSNGEKISEWFGWLAYVAHSDQLAAYELHADQVSARDKILLAPPPNYSMFQIVDGECRLNLDRILILDTPVLYRAAIVIAHKQSNQIISEMRANDSRELSLRER